VYGDDVILSIFAGRIRIKMIFLLAVLTLTFFVAPAFAITIRQVVCTANVNCSPEIQREIDISSPGDQILLPNGGTWLISRPIIVNKSVHIAGRSRSTTLIHRNPISFGGSGGIFHIDADNVSMSDFTIAADRAADPTFLLRTTAIRIKSGSTNIAIVGMGFRGITSSAILAQGSQIQNVTVIGSVADEFYEQFVELACGGCSNFAIIGNHARSSLGKPNLGATEPYPVMLTPGLSAGGLLSDVDIIGNTFDFALMSSNERVNTRGVKLSDDNWQNKAFAYDDIRIMFNTFLSQGRGVEIRTLQNLGQVSSGRVEISGNIFNQNVNEPIRIGAKGNGTVTISDNHIYRRESWGPYKLEQGANVVVLKSGNLCYQYINKLAVSPCN
jgi:hypothetical protein